MLITCVMVSMAILVSLIYRRPPARTEPVYHGKPLSKWLEQLDDGEAFGISSGTLPRPTPAQIEAAEAIHAMGAEALPLLMIDIHARPAENSLRFRVQRRLNSLISRALKQGFSFGDVTEKDRIRWRAAQGLAALGPLAKPALPELKRLLFTNYFHSSIKESAYALAAIGPEGVSILTNAVRPQAEWSGMCAIWALGQRPEAGTNVIPFLISATSSTSEGTACGAIQVLGLFQMDAEHVVPALTRALTSKNSSVSRDAASALGHFGPLAAPAAALLQTLTNDPATKASAIEALKQIQTIRR